MPGRTRPATISTAFVSDVCSLIRDAKPVQRELPDGGRLHVDRALPFLVVYRHPVRRKDLDTDLLVRGEASHLTVSGSAKHRDGVARLVDGVVGVLSESFGAVLLIELWASPDDQEAEAHPLSFGIHRSKGAKLGSTLDVLDLALGEIRIKGQHPLVEPVAQTKVSPPGMRPLMTAQRAAELNCHVIGIEVPPVYRDAATNETFPLVRRALHRGVSRSIQRAVFEFTRRQTSHRPPHYQALGRQSFNKSLWQVDRELAAVSNTFDFILQVTPTNVDEAWSRFHRGRFQKVPDFASRPLKIDPSLVKRDLFRIALERVEDPTLAQLLRDQQSEIDRKLTMLGDRGTSRFLLGSLQVYGGVPDSLLAVAEDILDRVPPRSRDESMRSTIDAGEFASRARAEIDYYRSQSSEVVSTVEIRPDVSALTVSRGNVLVPASARFPLSRVDALIAHEIGTHVVTYVNGHAQRFRQLYVGLPGYEELQEGIAVVAEYLAGGLSRPRLRLLAARIVASRHMIEGATFVEVFRELDRTYDFAHRTAFGITTRVFRGGGLTKDVSYLRGLLGMLEYLRGGGDFASLLVGKFGPEHIPIIEELRWREVLAPSVLRPRYLDDPAGVARLASLRSSSTVFDLINPKTR
ncbi:MAG: DUF1704 domain-containing protein [Demequinaceae bacterium]|nr:DUF1704 domain-containing protein [Demequinaceae bacterium]